MGSSYADCVRGLPKPVGFAKVPRSSETRLLDCANELENWSRDPPNHSFSLLLMSARLMETVPGMVYLRAALPAVCGRGSISSPLVFEAAPMRRLPRALVPMLCALRSCRVREARVLYRRSLCVRGCPDALLAASAVPAVCEAPRCGPTLFCYRVAGAARAESAL